MDRLKDIYNEIKKNIEREAKTALENKTKFYNDLKKEFDRFLKPSNLHPCFIMEIELKNLIKIFCNYQIQNENFTIFLINTPKVVFSITYNIKSKLSYVKSNECVLAKDYITKLLKKNNIHYKIVLQNK